MSQSALVGDALTPGGRRRVAVVLEGGRISEVVGQPFSGRLPDDYRMVQGLICPGFIDLQVNGAFGMEAGPDAAKLTELASRLPETGTTAFLPTVISQPAERCYTDFLEALGNVSPGSGVRMLGAHIEGPFLSPARKEPTTRRTCAR